MKTKLNTTRLTLWATRLVALVIFSLLFALPTLLDWYCTVRTLLKLERTVLTADFYVCVIPVGMALCLAVVKKENTAPLIVRVLSH